MGAWIARLHRIFGPILRRFLRAPRLRKFEATVDTIVVDRIGAGVSGCGVKFGAHPSQRPGILFEIEVEVRSRRHTGKLQVVQEVALHRERTPGVRTQTAKECVSSHGSYYLDDADPYEEWALTTVGRHSHLSSDSPVQGLNPSEQMVVDDKYRMYLMWRPDGWRGRWRVTLSRIEWFWKATVVATTQAQSQCSEGQLHWRLSSSRHTHSPDQVGTVTLARPITSRNISTVKAAGWQAC